MREPIVVREENALFVQGNDVGVCGDFGEILGGVLDGCDWDW